MSDPNNLNRNEVWARWRISAERTLKRWALDNLVTAHGRVIAFSYRGGPCAQRIHGGDNDEETR